MEINVLDVIIKMINESKIEDSKNINSINEKYKLQNCNYLLSQLLRNLQIPLNHILISQKAYNLWKEIYGEYDKDIKLIKIMKYRDSFIPFYDSKINVNFYKGGENNPYKTENIRALKTYVFNDIFHDEHIIPINIIIKKLKELNNLTYENVSLILDNIYICKMLKDEDRNIICKTNRPFSIVKIIEEIYTYTKNNEPIMINNWDTFKQTINNI